MNPPPVLSTMAEGPSQKAAGAAPGAPYALHLFVCTQGPDCPEDGPAHEIRKTLKSEIKNRALKAEVRVNQSGCLGQCGHGPMLVVYPEGAWYAHLDVDQALQILQAHLDQQPERVQHLRFRLGPGGNQAPKDDSGRRHCDKSCLQATQKS